MHLDVAELLRAVDLAIDGRWEESHRIVQQDEHGTTAAWIHAVLHKIEGDLGNSRYWYRRADRLDCVGRDPPEELRAIRGRLTADAPE